MVFYVFGDLTLDLVLLDGFLGGVEGLGYHVFVHVGDLYEVFVDLGHYCGWELYLFFLKKQ